MGSNNSIFRHGGDVFDRYAGPPPSLSPEQTDVGREAAVLKDLGSGQNTVARLAWDVGRHVTKLQSLVNAGKIEAARSYYDDFTKQIDDNRDSLLALASLHDAGKTGMELANRARVAVMSGFNDAEVTALGEKTTIGQVLAPGNTFISDQTGYLRQLGFDDRAASMYFGDKEAGYDDNDRMMMKSVIDPFFRADARNGAVVPNHIQLREFAGTLADMRGDLKDAFGDDANRVVQFLLDSHRESGGMAPTLRALADVAKTFRSDGMTGHDAADKVLSDYNALSASLFGLDPKGKDAVTPDQRRLFDVAYSSSVKAASRYGEMIRSDNAGFRRAFREAYNEFALALDAGVDLFTAAREGGDSPAEAIGEYVAAGSAGRRPSGGNIVHAFRTARGQIQRLITGGSDFSPAGDFLSGVTGTRGNTEGKSGGSSSCPTADAAAAQAQWYLLGGLTKHMVNHEDLGRALRDAVMGRRKSRELRSGLADCFRGMFHGAAASRAANLLADYAIRGVMNGNGLNVQNAITALAADDEFAKVDPKLSGVFRSWVGANVLDGEIRQMRDQLVRRYVANGAKEPEAQLAASDTATLLFKMKHSGANYLRFYRQAVNTAPVYRYDKDEKGNAIVDPDTTMPRIVESVEDYGRIFGPRFYSDPEYRNTVLRAQAKLAREKATGERIKDRVAMQNAREE